MKICIMATSENVEQVRATAYEKLPQLVGHNLLNYPASATGEEPVTHWICQLEAKKDLYDRLMQIKELSEMEASNLKDFLESKNLKLVKRK